MQKRYLFLLAFLGLTAACVRIPIPNSNQPEQTACTQEAKICPDGTAVGRTGPNCEFAPCPTSEIVPPSAEPQTPPEAPKAPASVESQSGLVYPVGEFVQRATKKQFGTFITPEDSPVQPERFRGYHAGVDIEYGDIADDVPVVAIAAGRVSYSGRVSGYGGVIVIIHEIDGQTYSALYGHLAPASLVSVGQRIEAGQQVGILGQGYSVETDNERKHLHFALYRGTEVNLKGYVPTESQLEAWVDPLEIFE